VSVMSLRSVVPALALLLASAAPAQPGADPIACIYEGAQQADLLAVAAGGAAGERVRAQLESCSARNGWTSGQGQAAFQYAVGSAFYDDAVRALTRRGVKGAGVVIEQVAADLGDRRIAALAVGETTDLSEQDIGRIVTRRLAATGFTLPNASPEWETVGVEVGRGMAGKYFRERALAAFNRR
jgi:hypothetical protein